MKTFLKWFWGLFAAGVVVVVAVFWMITKGWVGYLPPLEGVRTPKNECGRGGFSAGMQ